MAERVPSASRKMHSYEFKLFLEGVEIPMLGLDASFTSPSSFNIEVPPVDEVHDIEANTYAIIAFRKRRSDPKWYLLCEGVYIGPSYTKTGTMRSLRLKFRDVQWFMDHARSFDLISQGADYASGDNFALRRAVFIGDTRRDVELNDPQRYDVEANLQLSLKFDFLQYLTNRVDEAGIRGDSPLAKALYGIFLTYQEINDFTKAHAEGLQINNQRIRVIDNRKMDAIFKSNLLGDAFNRLMGESTSMTTVMDLMLMLFQMIQYDLSPIPGFAKDDESVLRSFLAKPHLHLTTPPACNVIFPDETLTFAFDVNFEARPTRLWYQAEVSQDGGYSVGYFAPEEVAKEFEDFDNEAKRPNRVYLTEEEQLRGIIPQWNRIPWAYTAGIGGVLDDEVFEQNELDRQRYMAAFVNYQYYLQKYQSAPMNLSTKFRPDIVPGFPVLVMDEVMPLIGYPVAVTHTIDIQNAFGSTGITLTHVRPARTPVPLLAGWYDSETFHPQNIGRVHSLIGSRPFFAGNTEPTVDEDDMVHFGESVKDLLAQYKDLGNDGGRLEELFTRDFPVFFDEDEGSGEVLDALNLTWNQDVAKLETKDPSKPSPLNVRYDDRYEPAGVSTTERRQPALLSMRRSIMDNKGIWIPNKG